MRRISCICCHTSCRTVLRSEDVKGMAEEVGGGFAEGRLREEEPEGMGCREGLARGTADGTTEVGDARGWEGSGPGIEAAVLGGGVVTQAGRVGGGAGTSLTGGAREG